MIRVEVTGAGPCSGLLLLPPKTAARWQAVRRRLACHQLVILAETLLQLAEKHCRQEAPVDQSPPDTIPSVQLRTEVGGADEPRSGTESALLPVTAARGLSDPPGHSGATTESAMCDPSPAEYHQRSEVSWGQGLTLGQPTASQLTPAVEMTPAARLPLPRGGTDAQRLTVVTLNRAEGALWRDATPSHVVSHMGLSRDHVTSHTMVSRDYTTSQSGVSRDYMTSQSGVSRDYMTSQSGVSRDYMTSQSGVSRDYVTSQSGVSRDQQVSVILSAEARETTVNLHAAIERPAPSARATTLPPEPLQASERMVMDDGDGQVTGPPTHPAAGFAVDTERQSPARPPGSTRACVLRRGRAICSTDGLTIDDAANAGIGDATCQAMNSSNGQSTGDISNSRGNDEAILNIYDPIISCSSNEEACGASANVSDAQNIATHQDQPSKLIVGEDFSVQPTTQVAAPVEDTSVKVSPPSLCADCDTEHGSAACPLKYPRCWVQDSPGGSVLETLPACLLIDGSTVRVGPNGLAAYTLLGPLVGRPVRPEQLAESVDLRHIWEIYGEGVFLDTSDPCSSSWFHLLRPAARRSQRTLAVVTRQHRLFAVTTCHLAAGTELTYWQDDSESVWRGKNMLKTRCGGCNARLGHPLYYRRHCSLFHEPGAPLTVRKYYCKVCGEGVLGRQKLLRHAVEQHDGAGAYQCQYCGKFFRRLSYLELHRNHGCAANPQRTHPLCHLCGSRFSQPQKLKAHIRRVHSDADPTLPDCRCPRCSRLLGCRTALRRHLREVHPSPERPQTALSCRRCGKQFQNGSNLKIHMLSHSGVKPFRCSIADCVAAFTTKQGLQQHYGRVHQLSGSAVPPIVRSVPYTLRGYSGHLAEPPPAARRRLLCRGERLRFPDFSVSRDLPEPSNGPRLMQDASRSELDSIEPSLIMGCGGGGGLDTEM